MTPVATPYLIRFVICCFDGCEWIAIIRRNTYNRKCCIWMHCIFIPMVCIASNDCNPFTSIKTTNYKSYQIGSCNWCHSRSQHYQTFPINYHLINSCLMSHAIKMLKLPCFSAVLLYTQLPLVLHQNDRNINFILITIPDIRFIFYY